jgi:hypothetical protein
MRNPITVNAEIYRVINRAIVTFTLLFDVTSHEFGKISIDSFMLDAQATSGEVLSQLGS